MDTGIAYFVQSVEERKQQRPCSRAVKIVVWTLQVCCWGLNVGEDLMS